MDYEGDEIRYGLNQLIEILEKINEKGEGKLNYPKAFLSLAVEIRRLNTQFYSYVDHPINFKKSISNFPKHIDSLQGKEFEIHEAKRRMNAYFESAKKEMEIAEKEKLEHLLKLNPIINTLINNLYNNRRLYPEKFDNQLHRFKNIKMNIDDLLKDIKKSCLDDESDETP